MAISGRPSWLLGAMIRSQSLKALNTSLWDTFARNSHFRAFYCCAFYAHKKSDSDAERSSVLWCPRSAGNLRL